MAVLKPTLSMPTFDATLAYTLSFNLDSSSDQCFGNRIIIQNNSTSVVVYDNTVTSFLLQHTINSGILTNGVIYKITLAYFNLSSTYSSFSDGTIFKCLATPVTSISNITTNQVVASNSYKFTGIWTQAQLDTLQSYEYYLYDKNGILLQSSATLFPSYNIVPTLVSTTGTLVAGTYYYCVTAVLASGETIPSIEKSIILASIGGVSLSWTAISGAVSYNVYGRTSGAEQLIANTVSASYTDSGSITPSGALPSRIQYQFSAFINSTTYGVQLKTLSSSGVEVDTAITYFIVQYIAPTFAGTLGLTNLPTQGGVQVLSNVIQIIGQIGSGSILYQSSDWVDLRSGMIYFDSTHGMTVFSNFSLKIFVKNVIIDTPFLTLLSPQGTISVSWQSWNNCINASKTITGGLSKYNIFGQTVSLLNSNVVCVFLQQINNYMNISYQILS